MSEAAVQLHKDASQFSADQLSLIKSTVAKGTTNDELSLFLYTAERTGLDPLMKQIHAIKRWSSRDGRDVMSIQTGIDGLRLIADRTERYAPGPEPVIVEDPAGNIIKATAYVKKWVSTEWHTIGATAYYSEYVQTNKDGRPIGLWAKMPRLMTAKCAEALALRKAFPAEMSGVYTFDETTQADSETPVVPAPKPAPDATMETLKEMNKAGENAVDEAHKAATGEPVISQGKGKLLYALAMSKGMTKDILAMNFKAWYGCELFKLPQSKFEEAKKRLESLPSTPAPDDDNQDIPL